MDVDCPMPEASLPPKLRKAWIAKSAERLREHKQQRDWDLDMDAQSPAVSDDSGGRKRSESVRDESYFGAPIFVSATHICTHSYGRFARYAPSASPAFPHAPLELSESCPPSPSHLSLFVHIFDVLFDFKIARGRRRLRVPFDPFL